MLLLGSEWVDRDVSHGGLRFQETMDASGVSGLHNSALLRTSGSVHAYKLAQESV